MRGADINFINKMGKTPLHHAIENNLEAGTIKFLLNSGANPHIEDNEGHDVCDIV
jgi:ankyrin repeat protein